MGTTVPDCRRIFDAAKKRGLALAVGHQQRFRTNNVNARRLIAKQAIGRIHVVRVAMPVAGRIASSNALGSEWKWWDDPGSVGQILNSGPQVIDLVRWLTGAEVSLVSARCRTLIPNGVVEDTTVGWFELSDGTICSLYSSRALPGTTFPGDYFRFRITGSNGLIDLDPYGELRVDGASNHSRQRSVTSTRVPPTVRFACGRIVIRSVHLSP